MKAATWPRAPSAERLLHVDPREPRITTRSLGELVDLLSPGDLVVLNDAATMPASLSGVTAGNEPVELRLVARLDGLRFSALAFGAGDWRARTEDRPPPPRLSAGARVNVGTLLTWVVESVDPRSPRLVVVKPVLPKPAHPTAAAESPTESASDEIAAFYGALYRAGKPVQYAYLERELALWHVQTAYSARPWAMEMPSAGRPLSWSLLLGMKRRGVRLAVLTHAAGLSSTGDEALDALLPMAERYDVPEATVRAIRSTKAEGGRVVAVGTTVVRAIEGCALAHGGRLVAGQGETNVVVLPGYVPLVVDGLLTGVHDPTASHYALLQAFAPERLLRDAYRRAEEAGYLGHEFGDSTLILPSGPN